MPRSQVYRKRSSNSKIALQEVKESDFERKRVDDLLKAQRTSFELLLQEEKKQKDVFTQRIEMVLQEEKKLLQEEKKLLQEEKKLLQEEKKESDDLKLRVETLERAERRRRLLAIISDWSRHFVGYVRHNHLERRGEAKQEANQEANQEALPFDVNNSVRHIRDGLLSGAIRLPDNPTVDKEFLRNMFRISGIRNDEFHFLNLYEDATQDPDKTLKQLEDQLKLINESTSEFSSEFPLLNHPCWSTLLEIFKNDLFPPPTCDKFEIADEEYDVSIEIHKRKRDSLLEQELGFDDFDNPVPFRRAIANPSSKEVKKKQKK